MVPASGTLIQCDLSPRNGRKRSIALEIEKGSRCYRLRVRDYSRDKPIVTKSLGIKCPDDIFTEKDALHHLKEHPEAWLYFEGIKEQMEEGIWPKELRQKVVSSGRTSVSRQFPHGSLGDMLRWYLQDAKDIGSENQKVQQAATARQILMLKMKHHEAFAHLDVSDLTYTLVKEMEQQWRDQGLADTSFRAALTLLSAACEHATARPDVTGCRRGPDFGKYNPFNTVRNEHSKQEKKDLADDGDKGPDPFNHDEARAILTVFRKTPRLRPYWPLVGLLMATGARPNEICALPWRNVLGLWEGFTMRSDKFIWTPEDRSLHGTPVFLNTAVEWIKAKNVLRTERFKCTKNQNERMPRVNRYIPGYEDLFKQCIEARLPARLEITNLPEFRDMLVFQGPRSRSSRAARGETWEQYTQHRTHRPKGAGTGSSRSAELHRMHARSLSGHLTHTGNMQTELPRLSLDDSFLPYDFHNFGRYWKQALELADVRYRNPYQCRHTYVSLMSYAGHSNADVARWIGDTEHTMKARYQGRILTGDLD